MLRLTILVVIVFLLAVLGGCLYLAYGDFPIATVQVDKVLPDARFPK